MALGALNVPGCGSTALQRRDFLLEAGTASAETVTVAPLAETPGFVGVSYTGDDSATVERVFGMGARELLVLQARMAGGSPTTLMTAAQALLRTAEVTENGDHPRRSVYLADRSREDIREDVNADVSPPPDVRHNLHLELDPGSRSLSVIDTMTVDFSPTMSDSVLTVYAPWMGEGGEMRALEGGLAAGRGDSLELEAGEGRTFVGEYTARVSGSVSGSADSLAGWSMQLRPLCSFQAGMWFYPGCRIPADYDMTFTVRAPDQVLYVPLPLEESTVTDSTVTIRCSTPEGGISGPLAWAAGAFGPEVSLAAGRSRLLLLEGLEDTLEVVQPVAERLASVLWTEMGRAGVTGLDIVVVRVIDLSIALAGPGCMIVSPDVLASLDGWESWDDSLSLGKEVPQTAIVAGATRSFLAGSTYLAPALREMLAARAVYLFAGGRGSPDGRGVLQAFRMYYLYETELGGGVEHALADPLLPGSPLAGPVITGKGPLVLELLDREIPAFGMALRRTLDDMRHDGDTYNRLLSELGLPRDGPHAELYRRWMYGPGVPRMVVTWTDSAGALVMDLDQLQPGQAFPLGEIPELVTLTGDAGSREVVMTPTGVEGRWVGELPPGIGPLRALELDPAGVLPADVVYSRRQAG